MTHHSKADGSAVRRKPAGQASDQDAVQREQGKPVVLSRACWVSIAKIAEPCRSAGNIK